MPKLHNRPPKFSKLKQYAVVYHHGKIHYLGFYGTPEALTAYNRFCAEIQGNPTTYLQKEEGNTTVGELAAAFLDHAKATLTVPNYTHHRIVVGDFLLKLYGDTLADKFKPSCLKLIRKDDDGDPILMLNIFAHNAKVLLLNYDVHGDKTNEPGCLKSHLEELFQHSPMLRLLGK